MIGYTSNERCAALMLIWFAIGGLFGANVAGWHWWLWVPALLLIIVSMFVSMGESGPNDPRRSREG